MERRLKNLADTMSAVASHCKKNKDIVDTLPALTIAVNRLIDKIEDIRLTSGTQESNLKGIAKDKNIKKYDMVRMASAVASAGQAYSIMKKDATLFEKLRYPESNIYHGRGQSAITKSKLVYDLLVELPLDERLPFGLTDDYLENLNQQILLYMKEDSRTRLAITKRVGQTNSLFVKVREGMSIVRNQLLKLARQLQTEHAEFYYVLKECARVTNPHTHTKLRIETVDELTGKAIEDAMVTVTETGQTTETSTTGKCSIYMSAGDFTVELTHKNYASMKMSMHVKPGSNTVKVEMKPVFVLPAEIKAEVTELA